VNVSNGSIVILNNVTLVMRTISLPPYTILIVFKLTSVNSGACVCDVAVYADPYAIRIHNQLMLLGQLKVFIGGLIKCIL
jgi:hypothetical protein